jgi:hypothetical protein
MHFATFAVSSLTFLHATNARLSDTTNRPGLRRCLLKLNRHFTNPAPTFKLNIKPPTPSLIEAAALQRIREL